MDSGSRLFFERCFGRLLDQPLKAVLDSPQGCLNTPTLAHTFGHRLSAGGRYLFLVGRIFEQVVDRDTEALGEALNMADAGRGRPYLISGYINPAYSAQACQPVLGEAQPLAMHLDLVADDLPALQLIFVCRPYKVIFALFCAHGEPSLLLAAPSAKAGAPPPKGRVDAVCADSDIQQSATLTGDRSTVKIQSEMTAGPS